MWNDFKNRDPLDIDSDSLFSGPLLGWLVACAVAVLAFLQ